MRATVCAGFTSELVIGSLHQAGGDARAGGARAISQPGTGGALTLVALTTAVAGTRRAGERLLDLLVGVARPEGSTGSSANPGSCVWIEARVARARAARSQHRLRATGARATRSQHSVPEARRLARRPSRAAGACAGRAGRASSAGQSERRAQDAVRAPRRARPARRGRSGPRASRAEPGARSASRPSRSSTTSIARSRAP